MVMEERTDDPAEPAMLRWVNGWCLTRRAFLMSLAAAGTVAGGSSLVACDSASDKVVEMTEKMAFVPAALTIKVGQTVTWRNTSAFVHTATDDPAKAVDPAHANLPEGTDPWDSGPLQGGQSWSHRFDAAGEYRYFCLPHELGGMVATITVEA